MYIHSTALLLCAFSVEVLRVCCVAQVPDLPPSGTTQAPKVFRLMSQAKDQRLRQQLPKIEDPKLSRLLRDPSLILYTEIEMPPAYQDWGSGVPGLHSPSYNISANRSEPFGNGNIEFPWGSPAGTHRTKTVSTFRFVWLPASNRGTQPIVWFRRPRNRQSQGGYAWIYPVGTVFGEVLRLNSPEGKKYVFEIRIRIRQYGAWVVDVFRPFPRSEDLWKRIQELRPGWEQDKGLRKLVRYLKVGRKLRRHTLADASHPRESFRQAMGVDQLPGVTDRMLIVELLTSTPFKSSLGETWRTGTNGVHTVAPTTLSDFHVVPANYDAGFIEVDSESCMRCHETVNRHVDEFQRRRDWYGRVRGSDGIFSFHPFSPRSISYNGFSRTPRMRKSLVDAGLLEVYDSSKHPEPVYQQVRRR